MVVLTRRSRTHSKNASKTQMALAFSAMKLAEGRVAIVTGGASGIGLALAERFARSGLHLVLADIEATALKSAAERIGAMGVDVLAVLTDVSDEASVRAL